MPVLADGSRCPWPGRWRAAGWLSDASDFATGPVGEPYEQHLFCERLFEACRSWTVNIMRGYQPCLLCRREFSDGMLVVERHGRVAHLGNGEVRARGSAGRWAAPTLVFHYVTEHGYKPPEGFVDAIMTGDLEAPEAPRLGGFRFGDKLGSLAHLDAVLYAEVAAEFDQRRGSSVEAPAVEFVVHDGDRFEPPGIWRPVQIWMAKPVDYPGGKPLVFDGTDSWRTTIATYAGDRLFRARDGGGR